MMRTRSLAASLLAFPAAALLALTGAGGANATPPASNNESKPSVARATVDGTGAAEYWTADRMRAAVPGDVLAGNALQRHTTPSVDVKKGKNTKVKASKANSSTKAALQAAPVAHIGKVFFTVGEANYVCSGNAVTSENQSTVATAGHCLNEGPGAFVDNFIFVPGYENGQAPYGRWTARDLYTTSQWEENGDIGFDTGFAVVDENEDGETLTDVVGGSGVEFNAARGGQYTSYGYPAAKPFNGQQLWSCTGTATDDARNPAFKTQGIPCTMTGGSSGGPWLLNSGYQNSVNSYGYSGSGVMFGPYWGEVIEETYTIAQAA